jgi:hypothetical protein
MYQYIGQSRCRSFNELTQLIPIVPEFLVCMVTYQLMQKLCHVSCTMIAYSVLKLLKFLYFVK